MNFKNKIVIITGAGKGIGRCIALTYAEKGSSVIIAEKNSETGSRLQDTILAGGGSALFIQTDVSQPSDIENMINKTKEQYGKIDMLINNAGFGIWKAPCELSIEEWDHMINTNLRGTFLCSREAAKVMRTNGGGNIVNIASTRALMSEPHSEAYAASKGGVVALTHALAASLAPDHIRVHCISPGWIQNEKYDELHETDHLQHFSGRVGKPEDIALACLYLTQDGNDFINAQNIVIDGGMTKKMIYTEE